jgi:hypothetical protein
MPLPVNGESSHSAEKLFGLCALDHCSNAGIAKRTQERAGGHPIAKFKLELLSDLPSLTSDL